jgi:molybdenum cofactor cytidylyltransferase
MTSTPSGFSNITGIILAAGASKRMGSPKALLDFHGTTFIRTVIEAHRQAGLQNIIVVLGADRDAIIKEMKSLDVTIVLNDNYESGQLSSIQKGVERAAADHATAVFVHPVDHPLIATGTVRSMLDSYRATPFPIVIPTFQEKRGHPVMFSSLLFHELLNAPPDVGARFVVWNHSAEILEIATDDPGILENIDTPESYENLRTHLRSPAGR